MSYNDDYDEYRSEYAGTPQTTETPGDKDSENHESPSVNSEGVKPNNKRRVHNLLILDESGSMQSIFGK